VTLLFFSQTFGEPESAQQTRLLLREVASLHEGIGIEEVNFVLDKERAAQFGVVGISAIALLSSGNDTRIRFLGAPAGYEFMSLIEAIIIAGTGLAELSDATKALLEGISEPLDVKVFVTPTCPHCPRAVTLAHKLAWHSHQITATCVEATEFLDMSRQYRVTGVPKTVVNGVREIMGAMPEDMFVREVLGVGASESSGAKTE
jgi:glutaredoxin-like protein